MGPRMRAHLALPLLGSLLAAACATTGPAEPQAAADTPERTDAAAAPEAADEGGPLTLGFVVDPSWAQVAVADATGLFEEAGVEVEVVSFATGAQALEALNGGVLDLATAGETPTSSAIIENPELRVVADGSRWTRGRFVTSGGTGIATLEDLEGRRIGVPLGSSAHYFASTFLADAGVEAELVQVGPPDLATALERGDIDVVAIFQPYLAQVADRLGDDAVEIEGIEPYEQHSLYLAAADTIAARGADITAALEALAGADGPLTEQDDAAVAAVAEATGLDPGLMGTVLGEFEYAVQLEDDLADELAARADWAIGEGSIAADTPVPAYADHLDDGLLGAGNG